MPCLLWDLAEVEQLMITCIVLHDMIVEDRTIMYPFLQESISETTLNIQNNHQVPTIHLTLKYIQQNYTNFCQEVLHHRLTNNLKIHNWLAHGEA